ncbi:MAG: putative sensory histidine-kinase / response regulator [Gammaproteobacteria bacterium]|jgi:PAS domain S-box-containing protein|nr:putative sensory histidine-kinase / response regulator [Gammaproteobacteria bacterium]
MVNKNLYPLEKVFDVLLTQTDSIIICLDDQGIILEFNHKAEDLYGWQAINVIGRNFFELCRRNNIEPPYKQINDKLLHKTIKNLINAIKLNDVENIIEWSVTFLEVKAKAYIVLNGINVTSYKHAEIKEKEVSNYLENIINNLPHFIFWKDKNSVFQGCNKKFALAAGLSSPKEIIGKTDYELPWEAEHSKAYIKDDQLIMQTGIPKLNFEEKQKQLDGSENIVLVSKVPVFDENNQISGILGIYTDITARKQAEARLIEAKKEAEAANEVKTYFIRNMEHDIRTPFNGIQGLVNILLNKETETFKKELLTDIANCTKQLLDYCNEVLDFSKIEAGSFPIIMKKFNLKNLLSDIFTLENPTAKFKRLKFKINYDERLPNFVISDEYRLKRILINIISNAIKFTQEGTIVLSVQLIKMVKRTAILRFICEDSGIGIPEDKLQIIFEKFSRVNPSNTGIYKGQGLGLRIVKQFVEELDGEIEVTSQLNKGTTFVCNLAFKLPLVDTVYNSLPPATNL